MPQPYQSLKNNFLYFSNVLNEFFFFKKYILEKLETHPAVIPAIAVEDTLKKYSDGKIEWTLERENLWRAQTPQGFIFEDILNSHIAFKFI
jgi:2-C-methyl-D-erythritol 4-phosphate cytidylyltransferase